MICFAKLNLYYSGEIQNEIQRFSTSWAPHFNTTHYAGEWTVLPLRSPGGKNSIIPDLNGENEFADTENMSSFPALKVLLNTLQCPIMSVRFLNLKAGAVIKPHRDPELSFEQGEARLHFPIITNPCVEFYVGDDRVLMNERECWYINANLTHRVANYGTSDRIHLVVDCKVNDWLEQIFEQADKKCKADEINTQKQRQIIEALKLQNTETSLALAHKLEQELSHG